jgi:UDP-glucose-4-epimerase GalE
MSVLVTGGAGYIGSHTARHMTAAGRDVVVLDSMDHGHREALPNITLVEGDVADRDLVTKTCEAYDVTQAIHFAAYKNVGESMVSPHKYWVNNVAGSIELFEALLACGVRDVVFSSSCSVNGTPDSLPVDEEAAIRPESVYAETKAMMERILAWYGTTNGLRSVCLRYFNAAGADKGGVHGEVWDHSLNLIPMAMKAALGRRPPLMVFGDDYPTPDGTCIRDYIHVDDLADAHVRALDHLGRGGDSSVLNVGTGIGSSVLEVIRTTERISGQQVPFEIVPRRAGDPVATYADPTRIRSTLGWRADRDLDDIVDSAWRWHSQHIDGY